MFVRGSTVFDRLAPQDVQRHKGAILLISFTAPNHSHSSPSLKM